jgi:hypothetical protein
LSFISNVERCPVALPGSLARQPALPGSLARQPCPAALPGSLARQPCPAAQPKNITSLITGRSLGQQNCKLFYGRRPACSIAYFSEKTLSFISALPGSLARQLCPAALPGSLARQPCPAALPGSSARQPCPAAQPGSSA